MTLINTKVAASTTEQDFTLASADTDGVKTAFTTWYAARTFSLADLNGALVTAGALERVGNVTVTHSNHTTAFDADAEYSVSGVDPIDGHTFAEAIPVVSANGNETLIGALLFAADLVSVTVPAAPMAAISDPGPWDLTPGMTIKPVIDGGAAETATFDAAGATLLADAGPYVCENGDDLTVIVLFDGATVEELTIEIEAETADPVESVNVEPFAFSDGDQLVYELDGATQTVTCNGAVAELTSGNSEMYDLNDLMTLEGEIEGVPFSLLINTAAYVDIDVATAAEVAADLNAQIAGSPFSAAAGDLVLSGTIEGTGGSVQVTGGTANAILGFATDVVNGTGDAANIAEASAAEVVTLINGDSTGSPASAVDGAVILTSAITGSASEIDITSGDMNTALAFPGAASLGSGNVANAGAVTAAELVTLLAGLTDALATDETDALQLAATHAGTASGLAVEGTLVALTGLDDDADGTGDVADIDAVTALEAKTIIEADTGASVDVLDDGSIAVYKPAGAAGATIAIDATSTGDDAFGFTDAVYKVGSVTIGLGTSIKITPPAQWLWVNAACTIYGVLRTGRRPVKVVMATAGYVPFAFRSLNEGTTTADLVAVPE